MPKSLAIGFMQVIIKVRDTSKMFKDPEFLP